MTSYELQMAMEEEYMMMGDARRCPRHPHVKTSSDDGMHDSDCWKCEAEMEDESDARMTDRERAEEWVLIHKRNIDFGTEAFEVAVQLRLTELAEFNAQHEARQKALVEERHRYLEDEDNIPF